ncbi:NUDIX hydrolase [Methylobacillus sp.]|uniref:NUDIX hydrolase n=1 Tax=Methylobacillus sp. TaxID=56818 RepID=UPI0012C544E1|nr:NUDIX hydrolase [Methylobacillus sp.]MPS47531.1 NUDIX domain-containing protein [Methylobacillus sp.]
MALTPHPIPATIAVVVHEQRVLLVRRANPPDAGYWGFPGGKINIGETMEQAATRELLEETGIHAEAMRVITAVDAFSHTTALQLEQHFVLIAVLCRWLSGTPVAADDALEAKWFFLSELDRPGLLLSKDVAMVAQLALSHMLTAED